MPTNQRRLQLLIAFLVAGLLAIAIAQLHGAETECDPDDPNATCFVIYYPGLCGVLEPHTYWWGFWGCENRADLVAEDVSIEPLARRWWRVTIVREFADGRRVIVVRDVKGR